jgi:hypothetical protein
MMVSAPLLASLRLQHHLLHVARRHELALLDVHRLARGGAGLDEVGLPAEEGRRLQHIDHGGNGRHFMLGVNVGQHRHADLLLDVGEDVQPLLHAQAAERLAGTAIGLVVGRFVDEVEAQRAADVAAVVRRYRAPSRAIR